MTPTREQVIEWAKEAGFVGYGEDIGEYTIPAPAFISRLERVIEAAMSAGRDQGLREAAQECKRIAIEDYGMVNSLHEYGECAAAIEQLRGK